LTALCTACYSPADALFQSGAAYVAEGRLRTLGSLVLALLVQAPSGVAPESSGSLIANLINRSTVVAKVVIIFLALFSIVSWGVILYKLWTFQRASRQSTQFLDVFRRSNKFSEVQAVCRSLADSPLVGLFQSGYTELTAQLRQATPDGEPAHPRGVATRPTLKSLPAVDRALMRASAVEVNKLERYVSFLATTASMAPFIGLFGTVFGIIRAFEEIARTGSTNLGAVAPGIAEALVATALGLFAAIPAVIAYNRMSFGINRLESRLQRFADAFHGTLSRELEREG
jgi:biopolymer transport protein TolQ